MIKFVAEVEPIPQLDRDYQNSGIRAEENHRVQKTSCTSGKVGDGKASTNNRGIDGSYQVVSKIQTLFTSCWRLGQLRQGSM